VAGSVLVLFFATWVRYAFVIGQAVVVAFFSELKYYGLRRIGS
jgi:hypothetical protein